MHPLPGLFTLAAIAACTAAGAQNLLANGGFEEGGDDLPGWSRQAWARGVAVDPGESRSGTRSLRVLSHGGMQSDLVPYAGGRLRVAGWMKTDNVVRGAEAWHKAALQLISYDADKQPVGHVDIELLEGTHDWRRVQGTALLSRAVAFVAVVCHLWGEQTTGTAWFDDITLKCLDADLSSGPPQRTDTARLRVDFAADLGAFRHLWLGSDVSYSDRVLTSVQQEAMVLARGIGFEIIRMHDCLHNPAIYSEDGGGNAVYRWEDFDRRIRAVLDHGMKPLIVLETTPPQFATGDDGLGWTNPHPPKGAEGFARWQALVRATVGHCKEVWGESVHDWYFEVWNEPDASGYFSGTLEEYLRVYDHAVAGATAADPDIRIGGPGGAGTGWLEPLLEHCASGVNDATGQAGCRIDFLSWHIYTVGVGIPVFDALRLSLKQAQEARKKFPQYRELATLITEWGCSSSSHTVHDTAFDAAFRTLAVRHFLDADITLALPFCLADGPYHAHDGFSGGLGLLTKIGVPKPSFRAFELLRRLEGRRARVVTDSAAVDGLAAISQDATEARVMLYNLVEDSRREPYVTEVAIELSGLEGEWGCRATAVGPGVCDPQAAWERMGRPEAVDREQRERLLAAAELPEPTAMELGDGELKLEMPGFSVVLLELRRE